MARTGRLRAWLEARFGDHPGWVKLKLCVIFHDERGLEVTDIHILRNYLSQKELLFAVKPLCNVPKVSLLWNTLRSLVEIVYVVNLQGIG
jgi:hypothetical protein